ncbi:MAG: phytanoyl-CoA dioxygenase family protein [Sphingobium sp.]
MEKMIQSASQEKSIDLLNNNNEKEEIFIEQNKLYSGVADAAQAKWAEIQKLGLAENIAELAILGYTVVPPEKLAPKGFSEKLLEAVVSAGRRQGHDIDLRSDGVKAQFGVDLGDLLFEDEIFIEAALNPAVQALTTYLLGGHPVLGLYSALIKGRSYEEDLPLHVDEGRAPPPLAYQSQVCNATWILTDYSRSDGSVCFVPGSHHYLRPPLPGEGEDDRVPVNAPAGSLVFWTGRTWHGAFARSRPGLRVNLFMLFFRPHLRPMNHYREHISPEMLKKYPGLARVLGMEIGDGWSDGIRSRSIDSYMMGRHVYD